MVDQLFCKKFGESNFTPQLKFNKTVNTMNMTHSQFSSVVFKYVFIMKSFKPVQKGREQYSSLSAVYTMWVFQHRDLDDV